MSKKRISRAEQEARTAALLQQMQQLSPSGGNKPASKPQSASTKGGASPSSHEAGFAGQARVISSGLTNQVLAAADNGEITRLSELVVANAEDLRRGLNGGERDRIKNTVRGFKDTGEVVTALQIARIFFEHGINFEPDSSDPITTRSLIFASHKDESDGVSREAANAHAAALRCGLKIDPKMTRLTVIRSFQDHRRIQDTRAYANLLSAILETKAVSLDSKEFLDMFDIGLSNLGFPSVHKTRQKQPLETLVETFERIGLAYELALKVLDTQSGFRGFFPQRMDMLTADMRKVAEKLHQLNFLIQASNAPANSNSELDERMRRVRVEILEPNGKLLPEELILDQAGITTFDARAASDLLFLNTFKLLKRAASSGYFVSPVTVNTTVASVNKCAFYMDKTICDAVRQAVREAFKYEAIKSGISGESLDIYAQYLIRIALALRQREDEPERMRDIAQSVLEIAVLCADNDILFNPVTMANVYAVTDGIELRGDLIPKREMVRGLIERTGQTPVETSRPERPAASHPQSRVQTETTAHVSERPSGGLFAGTDILERFGLTTTTADGNDSELKGGKD